jgi:hypothetical protein
MYLAFRGLWAIELLFKLGLVLAGAVVFWFCFFTRSMSSIAYVAAVRLWSNLGHDAEL